MYLSEITRTWNQKGFPSRKTNQWGSTRAYGTLRTGPHEAAWSKPTGPGLHLRPLTEISTQMRVCGRLVQLIALLWRPMWQEIIGSTRSWTPPVRRGWDGSRGITWFTTIALMLRGFHRACHQSVPLHREREREREKRAWSLIKHNIRLFFCMEIFLLYFSHVNESGEIYFCLMAFKYYN